MKTSSSAIEPTFADAISSLSATAELPDRTRQQWCCALRSLARCFDQPVETIPARYSAVRARMAALHHMSAGCSAKTLANVKSNAKAALLWFRKEQGLLAVGVELTPAWKTLHQQLSDPSTRYRLAPVMRYCSATGVGPGDFDDAVLGQFLAHRERTSSRASDAAAHQIIARLWNACAGSIADWPKTNLSAPPPKRKGGLPFESFPDEWQTDVTRYLEHLTQVRRLPDGTQPDTDYQQTFVPAPIPTNPMPATALPAALAAAALSSIDDVDQATQWMYAVDVTENRYATALANNDNSVLGELVRAQLVSCRGVPPNAMFRFKHALIRDAAYASLLRGRREQLHRRIVAAMEHHFPETVRAQPELVAQHAANAGLPEKAIKYWLKAGQRALTRAATVEATAAFREGLGLLNGLPEGYKRDEAELEVQLCLSRATIAAEGYAAPSAGKIFERARELCKRLNQPPELVSVLYGQWAHALMRTDLQGAQHIAEELLLLGETRQDAVWTARGCRLKGLTCIGRGEFGAGRH